MNRRNKKGISLAEIMITVAVLGVLAFVMPAGFRMLNGLYRQSLSVQVERDAQIALYQITSEVRNAHSIIDVTPSRLEIRSFDFNGLGFDSTSGLFDMSNLGTVVYEYVETGPERWLNKEITFGGQSRESRLFKNLLERPTATQPLFTNPYAFAGTTDTIRVVLRLKMRDTTKVYEDEAVMRAFVN